jgi:hypothetical protein
MRPPLGSTHLTSPVEHGFERHGLSRLVPRLFSMNPYGTARSRLLTTSSNASVDIIDESRDLPSLAIRPQDRAQVDIRHAAPELQV